MNVTIIFEEEGIDTSKIASEMLISVFASIAQIESENQSQRVKRGVEMMKEMNKFVSGVSFGYKLTKKGKLKVVNEDAEIVKRIYKDVINGLSLNKIAENLNKEKIKSPRNSIWRIDTLKKIIANKKYKNKSDSLPSKNWKEGFIPIVSEEMFYKANEMLTNNRRKKDYEKDEWDIYFNNILKCGFCGLNITNGQCIDDKLFSCSDGNINRSKYKGRIKFRRLKKAFYDLVSHGINKTNMLSKKIKNINYEIKNYNLKIESLKTNLSILSNEYINLKINYRAYSKLKGELINKIEIINNKMENLENSKVRLKQIYSLFKNVKLSSSDFDKKIFLEVVSYVVVGRMSNNLPEHYYVRFLYDPNNNKREKKDLKYFNKNFERIFLITSKQDDVNSSHKDFLLDGNKLVVTYEIRKEN